MKWRFIFLAVFAWSAATFAAQNPSTNGVAASAPVYVPDLSHASDRLAQTTLAWDAVMKATNAPAGEINAHLVFNFTNVSSDIVVISDAHPSCSCTSVQLPPLPWTIAPGTNGQIGVTVNLAGKYGTVFKTVTVTTDHGSRDLIVQVNILPPVIKTPTQEELMQQLAIAKVDRQAVFKGDCATCHLNPGQSRYGKDLYDADCGICHEAEHRATMVPDLHNLKVPTNEEFWRTWIAHGKPGSLMPAFSLGDGGALSDMQIASLVSYLNATIPSKVAPLQ
jgi:cytochrome c553